MDRHELVDRLPGERIRQRLPKVWEPADPDAPAEGGDAETDTDADTHAEVGIEEEEDDETVPSPLGSDLAEEDVTDEEDEDGRGRLRTILLGVSVFGVVLAIGAAVVRRVLGSDAGDENEDDEEEEAVAETETEEAESESSPPMDEGTAAALGLAFLLAFKAVRDRLSGPTG